MSTGAGRRTGRLMHRRGGRAPEIMEVPPALYTLRAIVLGVAAALGAVGVLAFAQMPGAVSAPSEAAAGLQPTDLAPAGCGATCLGRAGVVRQLDALPTVLDIGALAVVTRAQPETPLGATPPPAAASRAEPDPSGDDEDDHEDESGKKDRKGDDSSGPSGKSQGKGRDKDD
jgi:hypothetical protein